MPEQTSPLETALNRIYHELVDRELPIQAKDMAAIRAILKEYISPKCGSKFTDKGEEMTELWLTNCCAVMEVKNLSDCYDAQHAFRYIMGTIRSSMGGRDRYIRGQYIRIPPPYGPRLNTIGRVPNGTSAASETTAGGRPFIMFTETVDNTRTYGILHPHQKMVANYGKALKEFIECHELGPVVESDKGRNFTGNYVKVYVWQPDYDKAEPLFKQMASTYYPLD